MALYISYKDGREVSLHVGDGGRDCPEVYDVESVFADGHELDYIERRFENLPRLAAGFRRYATWFGDHAKFIVANW